MKYDNLEEFVTAIKSGDQKQSNLTVYLDNDGFNIYEEEDEILSDFPDFGLLLALFCPDIEITPV